MDYSKIQGLEKTDHLMSSMVWGSGHSLDATSGSRKAIVGGGLGLLSSHGTLDRVLLPASLTWPLAASVLANCWSETVLANC